VAGCDYPIFHTGSGIKQGALGNRYFINALRLLSCRPQLLSRLLVSEKYASQGLYTLKFNKAGKWRYVHIDDRVACRQSGAVNFCRNRNPNETFGMLLEKAYAKLHGCYEALNYGTVEKLLSEMTAAAGVQALRLDALDPLTVCDNVYSLLEGALAKGKVVGCGRFVPSAQVENPSRRQGISLDMLYQVVDVQISGAEPSADLDALTVGMVCVKNLQGKTGGGRFTGRWSYGHYLWAQYKEVGVDLEQATRELQHQRGITREQNTTIAEAKRADAAVVGGNVVFPSELDDYNAEDESDELDIAAAEKHMVIKFMQPNVADLLWMQIEDFVEVFTRLYVCTDHTIIGVEKGPKGQGNVQKKVQVEGSTKLYSSKWLPGDFCGGSGGPPILVAKQTAVTTSKGRDGTGTEPGAETGAETGTAVTGAVTGTGTAESAVGGEKEVRYAYVNDNFADNPMYPITVHKATEVGISLFQKDPRWTVDRLAEEAPTNAHPAREDRLRACMLHSVGIAFVVLRLSGSKKRVSEFRLKKLLARSETVQFSHCVSNTIAFAPGRYVVVPYTDVALSRAQRYALHFNYAAGAVNFELEDVLEQRVEDEDQSEDEADEQDDNDLLKLHDHDDEVSIMSYEKVTAHDDDELSISSGSSGSESGPREVRMDPVAPPQRLRYQTWEYEENVEDLGLQLAFGEVYDAMKYVKALRGDVRRLNGTIQSLREAQRAQEEAQEAAQKPKKSVAKGVEAGTE